MRSTHAGRRSASSPPPCSSGERCARSALTRATDSRAGAAGASAGSSTSSSTGTRLRWTSGHYGLTLDFFFAFDELDAKRTVRPADPRRARGPAASYVGTVGETYAGAVGKLLTAVEADGIDPSTYANGDLGLAARGPRPHRRRQREGPGERRQRVRRLLEHLRPGVGRAGPRRPGRPADRHHDPVPAEAAVRRRASSASRWSPPTTPARRAAAAARATRASTRRRRPSWRSGPRGAPAYRGLGDASGTP